MSLELAGDPLQGFVQLGAEGFADAAVVAGFVAFAPLPGAPLRGPELVDLLEEVALREGGPLARVEPHTPAAAAPLEVDRRTVRAHPHPGADHDGAVDRTASDLRVVTLRRRRDALLGHQLDQHSWDEHPPAAAALVRTARHRNDLVTGFR